MGEQAAVQPALTFPLEQLEIKQVNGQITLRLSTQANDPDPIRTIRTMLDQVLPGNTPPGPE